MVRSQGCLEARRRTACMPPVPRAYLDNGGYDFREDTNPLTAWFMACRLFAVQTRLWVGGVRMQSPLANAANADREKLRSTFTEAAELYDRVRPGYPDACFDDLVGLSGLPSGGRVLEIGCGTGQATLPMASRGYRITAVELGTDMATVARRKLAVYANVSIHTVSFEAWTLPLEPFDLVMAATAFHWIDPAVRWQKVAAALRHDGAAGVFSSRHVAGGDDDFFEASQACYEQYMPGSPKQRQPDPDYAATAVAEIDGTRLFQPAFSRHYVWEVAYSTSTYVDLLNTYSGHRVLDSDNRRRLFQCIADLIDRRFGGRIRKAYQTQLVVARRR